MLRVAMLIVGVGLVARPATAVVGDLNADGKVDLQDFFILADNFGREGAPEVCEDPDTPGDDGGTGPILDAIGDSTTLALASFNIRIFSTGSRDDTELPLIADRLQRYDLIAIQEVRDTEVVDRVLAVLAGRGLDYEAIVSEPVGRVTTERYAFMWRTDVVQILGDIRIYPDPDDGFIREPAIADFQAGTFDFTLITIHSIYGNREAERRAEAELLDEVYAAVQDADPLEQDVILLGDFNLPPEDAAFADLTEILEPLITGTRHTTISENAKSLYDNIWFDAAYVTEYTGQNGVDDFDVTVFDNDDRAASLAVSDHRPIWATFRTDGVDDD